MSGTRHSSTAVWSYEDKATTAPAMLKASNINASSLVNRHEGTPGTRLVQLQSRDAQPTCTAATAPVTIDINVNIHIYHVLSNTQSALTAVDALCSSAWACRRQYRCPDLLEPALAVDEMVVCQARHPVHPAVQASSSVPSCKDVKLE